MKQAMIPAMDPATVAMMVILLSERPPPPLEGWLEGVVGVVVDVEVGKPGFPVLPGVAAETVVSLFVATNECASVWKRHTSAVATTGSQSGGGTRACPVHRPDINAPVVAKCCQIRLHRRDAAFGIRFKVKTYLELNAMKPLGADARAVGGNRSISGAAAIVWPVVELLTKVRHGARS